MRSMQLTRSDITYAYLYLDRGKFTMLRIFLLKIAYIEIGKNLIHLSDFAIFIIVNYAALLNKYCEVRKINKFFTDFYHCRREYEST